MPELKINGYTFATQADGNNPVLASNVDMSNITLAANHAGVKTALNASGNAPIYACRAWVHFDGVEINGATNNTSAITGSEGITSVSERSAGKYEVNLNGSFVLPSTSVCVLASGTRYDMLSGIDSVGESVQAGVYQVTSSTSIIRLNCGNTSAYQDFYQIHCAVFY